MKGNEKETRKNGKDQDEKGKFEALRKASGKK